VVARQVKPAATTVPVESSSIRVRSPQGFESTVPRDILDALLASGYVVVK
jgi:hypothetical protein